MVNEEQALENVTKWANEIGIEIDGYLGSGESGLAYLTSDNKVMKITNHKAEFVLAMKIKGLVNKNVVDVYDTKYLDDDRMMILMEKLEIIPEIIDMFCELQAEANEKELDILELVEYGESEFFEYLSEDANGLLVSISLAAEELSRSGFMASDIHNENIGLKANGNYALFDQFDASTSLSEREFKNLIKEDGNKKNNKRKRISKNLGI